MKIFLLLTLLLSINCYATENASKASEGGSAYASVNGLVCDFCARALEKTFSKKEEVNSIKVDLDEKIVTINFNSDQQLDETTITQLITDAGYSVEKITYEN